MGASADLLESAGSSFSNLYSKCADCIFVFLLCAAGNGEKMLAADKSGTETAKTYAADFDCIGTDYDELGHLHCSCKLQSYY